jgi:mono/diheme cytochrome c family protein
MRKASHNSSGFPIAIILFLLILCVGFVVAPSKTFAQPGSRGQGATDTTAAPAKKPAVVLPEGDGKAIAVEYCQDCHMLTNLTKAHKSLDDWKDTVQTMMDRGARLPQEQMDTLVQYLAKNFGDKYADSAAKDSQPAAAPAAAAPPTAAVPSAPAMAAQAQPAKPVVELPEGDGKPIATEYCQDCHRLTNLTKAHKSLDDWQDTVQTMMDRGARIPQDQVDTLVKYLVKNFGPQASSNGPSAVGVGPANP